MSEIKGNFDLMKKVVSKLRQCFSEHIDDFRFIFSLVLVGFGLLLGALAVAVMVSDSAAGYLQPLLREKYEVLKIIGFCIAGVVSIWLALSADKRANAMDATAKNTEEGQRQERLKNAIEHLGHKRDSVRMGGAYELFHLAKDMKGLRQTVMDILCAHIRQTTTGQTTRGKDYQAEYKTKPSEEIQSLLTLLFVQEHNIFEGCSINLQGSYLNGANLFQARLKKANLIEAQLQEADLRAAQLQEADLRHAQLQKTRLMHAELQDANLWEAQLQEADLRHAQLQKAALMHAELQNADLTAARLQGASLGLAQLQKADLFDAQLQGADFGFAQLQGADLGRAQLQGAHLGHAQLQGANLIVAQLQEANLGRSWLQEANLGRTQLQGTYLGRAQLQGADLREAQLQGADLLDAQLQGADLSAAQLQGANLLATQLQGADLGRSQLQGANLMAAQLQGADLRATKLQGVSSQEVNHLSLAGFESEIENRIGKDSDLTGIIFSGGLEQKDLDTLCECLSAEKAQELREKLTPHIGQPASHELPENSGAKTGAYTQKEAERWIAEYNKAMSEAPSADDTDDAASTPDSDKDKGD